MPREKVAGSQMESETVFQLGVDGSADDQFRLFDYKRTDVDRCVYPSAFRNVLLCMGKHGISGTTDTGVVNSMDYGVLGWNDILSFIQKNRSGIYI